MFGGRSFEGVFMGLRGLCCGAPKKVGCLVRRSVRERILLIRTRIYKGFGGSASRAWGLNAKRSLYVYGP